MREKVKTVTVVLDEPVTVNGTTYAEITLERRKAKHLAATDAVQGQARKSLALYAAMASVPLAVIEEMDGDDFERLVTDAVPLMGEAVRRAMEEQAQRGANPAID